VPSRGREIKEREHLQKEAVIVCRIVRENLSSQKDPQIRNRKGIAESEARTAKGRENVKREGKSFQSVDEEGAKE